MRLFVFIFYCCCEGTGLKGCMIVKVCGEQNDLKWDGHGHEHRESEIDGMGCRIWTGII